MLMYGIAEESMKLKFYNKLKMSRFFYKAMLCHYEPRGADYRPERYADHILKVVNPRLTAGLYRAVSDRI